MKGNFMSKHEVFSEELYLIDKENLKDLVQKCLDRAPEYFYTMPASTTGKYHPEYSLGEGGLVRHTKAAVKIAKSLLDLEMYAPLAKSKDQIIAALILHDSVKKGFDGSQWTTVQHPLDAASLLCDVAKQENYSDEEEISFIASMIRSHMGQWNTDKNGNAILPKPETKEQKFVHQCDYLASRKFITIEGLV